MLTKTQKHPFPHGSGCFVFYEIVAFLSAFGKFFLLQTLSHSDGHGDGGADHRVLTHPYNRRPLGFASVWSRIIPLLMETSESARTPCWCFWLSTAWS